MGRMDIPGRFLIRVHTVVIIRKAIGFHGNYKILLRDLITEAYQRSLALDRIVGV